MDSTFDCPKIATTLLLLATVVLSTGCNRTAEQASQNSQNSQNSATPPSATSGDSATRPMPPASSASR